MPTPEEEARITNSLSSSCHRSPGGPPPTPKPLASKRFPRRCVCEAWGQAAASLAACPLGRGFEPESAWGVSTKKAHRMVRFFCASPGGARTRDQAIMSRLL